MLLLRTDKFSEGTHWQYEVKLDSYRAIAFKSGRGVHIRSRNNKDFNLRYASTFDMLDETVIDGEIRRSMNHGTGVPDGPVQLNKSASVHASVCSEGAMSISDMASIRQDGSLRAADTGPDAVRPCPGGRLNACDQACTGVQRQRWR